MTDSHLEYDPPEPIIKEKANISMVWLIPIITALIGGWLIVKTISEKGPQIEVTFKTAEGIEAGKTRVKYKEIDIGMVEGVEFSTDFSNVILKISLNKGTELFLGRGTRFWVVKPRLSLRGASGLGTLLSGSHIEIEPGQGEMQTHFEGLDKPPVVRADVAGTKITLLTNHLSSIDAGSPIYYQGILVGEILGWELGNDRKSIFIHAFVKAPFNKLVKSNTRFWNISGVDLSMGAEGISLQTESLQSLLYGGIAFETPDTREEIKEDVEGLAFTLYPNYASIHDASFVKKITCVLFFEGSVRGLKEDAPVEFKGIKVGVVKKIQLEFDSSDASFRIPVLVEIEPERFLSNEDNEVDSPLLTLNTLISHGLRARLQTGSLLTGQLFVELDMHPNTPARMVDRGGPFPELPTISGELAQMTTSVKNILTKMEKLNIEKIGAEFLGILESANSAMKGAGRLADEHDLEGSVVDFKTSLTLLKQILSQLDQRVEPIATNLENAIGAGHKALENTQTTLNLVNEVLSPDSPLQYRFIELTSELSEMARSIRILVDMLERSPNAIIFGKEAPPKKIRENQ
ncbi:MAG: MCE family protein [Desulfobacteraceae bacterium]|nr:MCE family protein [Desulfobacteraceae bacterium]